MDFILFSNLKRVVLKTFGIILECRLVEVSYSCIQLTRLMKKKKTLNTPYHNYLKMPTSNFL